MINRRNLTLGALSFAGMASTAPAYFSSTLGAQAEFFDWQFYANHNPDLVVADLLSATQLRNHWLYNGLAEGRYAHPEIHVQSYRARYPDLDATFGTNWSALYNHYVNHGQYEGRDGTMAGEMVARLGEVSLRATPRCAGAIDSLFFGGAESVNSYDHGRQIQTCCVDTRGDACFNPTQAGRRADGRGYPSSSQLLSIVVSNGGKTLRTRTLCAYWAGPGETIGDPGMYHCTATTGTVLSEYIADTTYTLTTGANGTTVIEYDVEWTLGSDLPGGVFMSELVTGYHGYNMRTGYEVLPGGAAQLRHMANLTDPGQERDQPMLLTTPTGSRSIGIYSAPVPDAYTRYCGWAWNFGTGRDADNASKWSLIRRYQGSFVKGDKIQARAYIVVGEVTPVHQKIVALMAA